MIIIIGGGAIGCAIAYELAKKNYSVTLIERGMIGQQTTRAAAGMLAADAEAKEADVFWELCRASQDIYPQWKKELESFTGVTLGYNQVGLLRLAITNEDELALKEKITWLKSESGWMNSGVLRTMVSDLGPNVLGGIRFPKDHQLDPRSLALALRVAIQQLNVQIREGCEVQTFIKKSDNQIGGVILRDGQRIEAEHVILCGGVWSPDLLKDVSIELPIIPVQGQCYRLRPRYPMPAYTLYTKGCYMVPRDDGTLVVGATQREAGFDVRCTVEAITELHEKAVQVVPHLKEAELLETWVGLRPGTPDTWPILGQVPGVNGLTLATGHFRNGILLTPITAKIVAASVAQENLPFDWSAFSIERFKK